MMNDLKPWRKIALQRFGQVNRLPAVQIVQALEHVCAQVSKSVVIAALENSIPTCRNQHGCQSRTI
jgi:hypothetical protein